MIRYKRRVLRFADVLAGLLFPLSPKRPTYFGGRIVWLPKENWASLYHRHEQYLADAIGENLRRDETFLDVGANVGWFSLFTAGIVGPDGRVVSFEPSPDVFQCLSCNVGGLKQVEAFPFGIGNKDSTEVFVAQGTSSSASFIEEVTNINRHHLRDEPITKVPVRIRKLDTLVMQLQLLPNLVKIDVEGFEFEVLKGAERLLNEPRPTLIIEIHPPQLALSGGTESELFRFLQSQAYHWQVIDRNPNSLYTIVAKPH
jgi:FkbM family methyltransferase